MNQKFTALFYWRSFWLVLLWLLLVWGCVSIVTIRDSENISLEESHSGIDAKSEVNSKKGPKKDSLTP